MKLKFKDKMRILGLNQEALSKKVGVSRTTICKWQTGEAFPRHEHLIKLAEVLEIKPSALIVD